MIKMVSQSLKNARFAVVWIVRMKNYALGDSKDQKNLDHVPRVDVLGHGNFRH